MVQLNHGPGPVLMDHVRQALQPLDVAVVSNGKLLFPRFSLFHEETVLRDDQADAASRRSLTVIGQEFVGDFPVIAA